MPHSITSFYFFAQPRLNQAELSRIQTRLLNHGKSHGLKGLLLLSSEGYNVTISGTPASIEASKKFFENEMGLQGLIFKDSVSEEPPYLKYKVQIREEIVTIGNAELATESSKNGHVAPSEFHELMRDEAVVTLDTRNRYETKIGKFKNAVDLELDEFAQFPEKIQNAQIPKDKTVLIYCTGGIRCEKAIVEMQKQGFKNVLQLSGGILKYLEEVRTESLWEGDCFVFDRRVAVDQNLMPTQQYTLCPHCGQPAGQKVTCLRCDNTARLCDDCCVIPERQVCSKNCLHHLSVRPGIKGPQQRKVLI